MLTTRVSGNGARGAPGTSGGADSTSPGRRAARVEHPAMVVTQKSGRSHIASSPPWVR